jgi:thiazole synthase ThiGH ThiG subunit
LAKAFKKAIEVGREALEIGLAEKLNAASATSLLTGFLTK